MTDTNIQPIFIVGVPRSGTTLLAAMLGAHSRISCGAETHFFRLAATRLRNLDDLLAHWPESAVAYLDGLDLAGRGVLEVHGLTPANARAYLAARPPSVRAALEAITEQFMRIRGKARWCEKTPGHLAHIGDIRRAFPTSPIIRITRDPRDVALSLLKVPWGPTTTLEALQEWTTLHEAGDLALKNDVNAMSLSYEELLAEPGLTMRRVCAFLGEAYEESMLNRADAAVTLNLADEPWKANTSRPLDTNRAGAWKQRMPAADQGLALLLTGRYLSALGYETAPLSPVQVIGMAALSQDPHVGEYVLRHRLTLDPTRRHEHILFLGWPNRDRWIDGASRSRLTTTLSLLALAISTRARGGRVMWLPGPPPDSQGGKCDWLLARFLAWFATPVP